MATRSSNLQKMELPLRHMTTQKYWADIVLNSSTLQQIDQLRSWLNQHTGLKNKGNKPSGGYRVLLYGADGTGKSTTAAILAKEFSTGIYSVDLSSIVSKYIGETEKNIARLFSDAQQKGSILFFDKADALFGKRTEVKDSHDRYANLDTNYLLQRMDDYNGLVIVASNSKSNIDDALLRRFQSVIHFPLPTKEERKRIWALIVPDEKLINEAGVEDYELTPAEIVSIAEAAKTKLSSETGTGGKPFSEFVQAELQKFKP